MRRCTYITLRIAYFEGENYFLTLPKPNHVIGLDIIFERMNLNPSPQPCSTISFTVIVIRRKFGKKTEQEI